MCLCWIRGSHSSGYEEFYHLESLLATCFILIACLAYSSTLKLQVTCSSEKSSEFRRTVGRYIPEDGILEHSF
jgi:hypothetical protein